MLGPRGTRVSKFCFVQPPARRCAEFHRPLEYTQKVVCLPIVVSEITWQDLRPSKVPPKGGDHISSEPQPLGDGRLKLTFDNFEEVAHPQSGVGGELCATVTPDGDRALKPQDSPVDKSRGDHRCLNVHYWCASNQRGYLSIVVSRYLFLRWQEWTIRSTWTLVKRRLG